MLTSEERIAPTYGPDVVTLRELGRRVARRGWLAASVAGVVVAAVAIYAFTATPRYRSTARLRIDTQTSGPAGIAALADQAGAAIPGAGGAGGVLGLGRDELETEIGVLQSNRIADAAIDSLAIGLELESPNVERSQILDARVADPTLDADGKLTLERGGNGRYSVKYSGLEDVSAPPSVITPNVPVKVGGIVFTLNPRLLTAGPDKIVLRVLPRYKVHKLLEKRLTIAQQEGGSRLVEVSFEDADRFLAQRFVNVLVNEYIGYTTNTARGQDTTTVTQLQHQVDSTARKLAESEAALRAFEERSRLIAPEEQASAQVKRISAISAHVDAISTERNALAQMISIIQQRSRGGTDATAYRQLATFPSLITNRAIQDLLQSLVELENKRAQLGATRTANNVDYKQLTDRITEIERQLYTVGPQYLESLDQQLAMTVRTVTALTDTLDALPAATMQYGRLVRDRTVLETFYVALQKQLKQAELRDVLRLDRIRLVDAPRVANRRDKAFPQRLVMLAVGVILGVTLGLAAALFAEILHEPA